MWFVRNAGSSSPGLHPQLNPAGIRRVLSEGSPILFPMRRFAALICLLWAAVAPVRAAVVTSLTHSNLQAALFEGGNVTFSVTGTISLTNQLLVLRDTVLDATSGQITLTPSATNRLLYVSNGVALTVSNVNFQNGRAPFGGAIWNDGGTVSVFRANFIGNRALGTNGTNGVVGKPGSPGTSGTEARGGAIYSTGPLSLGLCAFTDNAAIAGDGGAGGNGSSGSFGGDGGPGGNGAGAWGGAVFASGPVTAETVSFSQNEANAGDGGVGGAGGSGSFPGKSASPGTPGNGLGGAIYAGSTVALTNVTFADNGAFGGAGPTGPTGGVGRDGGTATGGAVVALGTVSAANTTFAGNRAAGGKGGDGGASSFGGAGANGGAATGGSIHLTAAGSFVSCTWTTNNSIGGTNGLGGSGSFPGAPGSPGAAVAGNINAASGASAALLNSIVAYGRPANMAGTTLDLGYNISSDNSVGLSLGTSRKNLDPLLEPLLQNNGFVRTVGLKPNSAARDTGAPSGIPTTDARGVTRPTFSGNDVGAFEYATVFTVSGRVTEGDIPLSGIGIFANNVGVFTLTDGRYAITNLLPGTYTVTPTNVGSGYTPASYLVTIGATNAENSTGFQTNVNFKALGLRFVPRTEASSITTNQTGQSITNPPVLRLGMIGTPRRDYRLQISTNLSNTNWIDIAGIRTDFQGLGEFSVTNYPALTNTFFRTLTP